VARGDTLALRSRFAPDLVWVVGASGAAVSRQQLLAAVGRPQTPAPRYEIDSVNVRLIGTVAIVDYLRTDHRQVASWTSTVRSRVLEVFVRSGKSWLLERHSQTWFLTPTAAADSAALDAFIGHYEIGPGYVDDVHREGRDLVATASGQTVGARLVPVSASAFNPDGVGPLMVFERDSTGRVTGYVQGLPDGSVIRARRIR
jgi:hypothetical protein